MVATTAAQELIYRSVDRRDKIPQDGGAEIVAEMEDRIREALERSAGWSRQAYEAFRYYRSDQFRKRVSRKEKTRIRLVANTIRRDVDYIGAEILDAKPVGAPVGRNPRHYELGRQLHQLAEWSRDEEENWETDLERAITFCIHTGEGTLFEGWDAEADHGRGLPTAVSIDPRFVLFDWNAQEIQRDDAEWIVWISHEPVSRVELDYPDLEGQVQAENYEYFLSPLNSSSSRSSVGGMIRSDSSMSTSSPQAANRWSKVWVKRQWSKKISWEKIYFYADSGLEATVTVEGEEEERPLTGTLYKQLPDDAKDMLVARRRRKIEIWEDVAINNRLVEHHLSPFDRSMGGHGKYPFVFFQYERLPDEHRARGEISFLIQAQDITNEAVTQLLEQLFLNNVGYWHTYKGALDPSNRERLNSLFADPHQVIESYQGLPAPQHVGTHPGGLQAAASVLPILKNITDHISGVQEVDRGNVPGHIQSGRAIRALQAKTSRLNLKIRRHMESALRRATLLRLNNIIQFMRGPRIMEILDAKTQQGKLLFLGHSEEEVVAFHGLIQAPDEKTGEMEWQTPQGRPAQILVLNDEIASEVFFERVKITLDSGQEANRLERMDQAEMVLNIVGAAGIPWAARQLAWSNADELLEAIEKNDLASQLVKAADQAKMPIPDLLGLMSKAAQFQESTGLSVDQALEMVASATAKPSVPQPGGMPVPGGMPGKGGPAGMMAGMPKPPGAMPLAANAT